jgi:hypothetical protein
MMYPINPSGLTSLEECAAMERAKLKAQREINRQAAIASAAVCGPKCQFSRTCNKTGQKILDCDIVKKDTPAQGWG